MMAYACVMSKRTESESRALVNQIAGLQTEHRDLDAIIEHLEATAFADQLALRRLKKRKLQLKDEIEQMKMLLVPDIPA
jgi:hypothetical protein